MTSIDVYLTCTYKFIQIHKHKIYKFKKGNTEVNHIDKMLRQEVIFFSADLILFYPCRFCFAVRRSCFTPVDFAQQPDILFKF